MYTVIGLAIGFLLGITGAGGSIFAIPLLLLFTDLDIANAMGLSLSAVFIAALYGCLIQIRTTVFLLKPTIVLALSGVVTAPIGRFISLFLPQQILELLFFCLAIYIAIWMWKIKARLPEIGKITRGRATGKNLATPPCAMSENYRIRLNGQCISCLIICGSGIGLVSGMLGVGGGFLIVPALVYMSGASMQQAVCSSLVVISAVSCSGFIGHVVLSESPHLEELAYLSIGSICGLQVSRLVSTHIDSNKLYKVFSISLATLATFILLTHRSPGFFA